jgi:RimJ/RimL family protein N-acetyltransferase
MDKYYTDIIESERLNTCFLTADDAEIWTTYFTNEECCRFMMNPKGYTNALDRAKEWIDFALLRYQNKRGGLKALIHKETGEFIGQCGLLVQEVDGMEELEIGYHLLYEHWHKGYAAEAANAFKDYAFGNDMAPSIVSIINPQNENSKKVAMRNGMQLEKQGIFRDTLNDIFRINRTAWLATK